MRQPRQQFQVTGRGLPDDLRRKRRRCAGQVPVGREPVANDLLVETGHPLFRGRAGLPERGVPIAARVAGEHLVGDRDGARESVGSELEFRVGQDDPGFLGDRRGVAEDLQRQAAQLVGNGGPDQLHRALERDVLIVLAHRGLPRRGEDGFGQAVAVLQAGRQLDAAHRLGGLVFLPARSGQVPAHDALDREHVEGLAEHGAPGNGGREQAGHSPVDGVVRHEVVGEAHELVEPPEAESGEQFALARNAGLENVVERADAVAGDHEHACGGREVGRGIRNIEVAHLARVGVTPSRQVGQSGCGGLV